MAYFLVYALQAAVIMSVLYLGYKWLLSSATFHRFNRFILLSIYAVSLLVPILMPIISIKTAQTSTTLGMPMIFAVVEPSVEVTEMFQATTGHYDIIKWGLLTQGIFALGISISMIVASISVIKMIRLFFTGKSIDGYPDVVVSKFAPGPFSWGNKIMLRPQDLGEDIADIVSHERAHISRYHWLDLMLGHLVIIFQWFSPAAYLMLREIRLVHEYEVDEEVSQSNPYAYQMMLIKKAAGSSFPTFADSLNSQLKLRITMMLSKKSRGCRRYAALALVPMAAIAVLGLSQPAMASLFSTITSSEHESASEMVREFTRQVSMESKETTQSMVSPSEGKISNSSAITQHQPDVVTELPEMTVVSYGYATMQESAENNNEKKVYTSVDEMAEFPGGVKALYKFLGENLRYPENKEAGIFKVVISFTVGEDGTLSDMTVTRSAGEQYDNEAMRVLKLSPKWTPAKNNGKPVASKYTIPLTFTVKDSDVTASSKGSQAASNAEPRKSNSNTDELLAKFPGGSNALMSFIASNITMPEGVEGKKTVILKLQINTDGSVSNISVVRSGGEKCDNEAIRVCKKMPKWTPAKKDGKPVTSNYTLPFTFSTMK